MKIVAALGGNALARRGEQTSPRVQRENLAVAARAVAAVVRDHATVVTHGELPRAGPLPLGTEAARPAAPSGRPPLDVIGAESAGMVGYLLEQALRRELPDRAFATLVMQTAVDAGDPAFAAPSTPVGPPYPAATARRLARERGIAIVPDAGGWRLIVPAPEPRSILTIDAIAVLLDAGVTVIAAGGGGVPVVLDDRGRPRGVEGVVDKDLAAALLAAQLGAELLLLVTDVGAVYRDFGTASAVPLRRLDPGAADALLRGGDLGIRTMAPKVRAAARFARAGGTAVICALQEVEAAVGGTAGTRVARSRVAVG